MYKPRNVAPQQARCQQFYNVAASWQVTHAFIYCARQHCSWKCETISNPILPVRCPVQNGEKSTKFQVLFLPRTYVVKLWEGIKIQRSSSSLVSSWQCRFSFCSRPLFAVCRQHNCHHQPIPDASTNCVRTRSLNLDRHLHTPDWHAARQIKSNEIQTSGLSSLQAASNKSLCWTKSTDHMWRLKPLWQRTYTGTMERYMMYCKNDCCFVVWLELSTVSVRYVFEATVYMLRTAVGIFISCLPSC